MRDSNTYIYLYICHGRTSNPFKPRPLHISHMALHKHNFNTKNIFIYRYKPWQNIKQMKLRHVHCSWSNLEAVRWAPMKLSIHTIPKNRCMNTCKPFTRISNRESMERCLSIALPMMPSIHICTYTDIKTYVYAFTMWVCLCEKLNELCVIEETQRTPIGIQGSQTAPISHYTITVNRLHYQTLMLTILKDAQHTILKNTQQTKWLEKANPTQNHEEVQAIFDLSHGIMLTTKTYQEHTH